jgi:hypothetical protein
MAKAIYHRYQRVWVETVGTWANIEKINPVWVKGFEEPVRITYDCGLGRDFTAEELNAQADDKENSQEAICASWTILRARNKLQTQTECGHHPQPGTFPVVVTDPNNWGGWRVSGAEYDRDPELIEQQARLIATAPRLYRLAKALKACLFEQTDTENDDLIALVRRADELLKYIDPAPTDKLSVHVAA